MRQNANDPPQRAGRKRYVLKLRKLLADAELLGGHAGALDTRLDLLEGDLAGVVRRAVVGLLVDRERREPTVIRGTQPLLRDEVGGTDEHVADLVRALGPRRLRHRDADVTHLIV